MSRRSFLIALALLSLATLRPAAATAQDPSSFIKTMGAQALAVLNSDLPPAQREARFRQLFRDNFDTPAIARFVLGRYWRIATEAERREFMKLFEDYIVLAYSARLSGHDNAVFKVQGSRSDQDGLFVASEIIPAGSNQPLKVDWRLLNDNGSYKIGDVIVDGISMAVTQRSEFASVIQRSGGRLQGLLAAMREKIASNAH
jgi:phospholipid transport system substrate-binding protein